jgi:glyoxylase-like metal-dependent hydrolase (beta-lactamase superfamily II)
VHTAGHQSLLVSCPEASVLLVGDACYTRAMLADDAFPPFAADAAEQSRTYVSLRQHAERGAALVFSHDESNWNAIPEELR